MNSQPVYDCAHICGARVSVAARRAAAALEEAGSRIEDTIEELAAFGVAPADMETLARWSMKFHTLAEAIMTDVQTAAADMVEAAALAPVSQGRQP